MSLQPLSKEERVIVQTKISDCNTYQIVDGVDFLRALSTIDQMEQERDELLESIRLRKWVKGIPTRRRSDEAWIRKTEALEQRQQKLVEALRHRHSPNVVEEILREIGEQEKAG